MSEQEPSETRTEITRQTRLPLGLVISAITFAFLLAGWAWTMRVDIDVGKAEMIAELRALQEEQRHASERLNDRMELNTRELQRVVTAIEGIDGATVRYEDMAYYVDLIRQTVPGMETLPDFPKHR